MKEIIEQFSEIVIETLPFIFFVALFWMFVCDQLTESVGLKDIINLFLQDVLGKSM